MGVMGQVFKKGLESNKEVLANNAFAQKVFSGNGGDYINRMSTANQVVKDHRATGKEFKKEMGQANKNLRDSKSELAKLDKDGADPADLERAKSMVGAAEMDMAEMAKRKDLRNQQSADNILEYGRMGKDWITGADYAGVGGRAMAVAGRAGLVGAGVVGVGTAGRALTGGSFTQNNTGERDIAGIPFI